MGSASRAALLMTDSHELSRIFTGMHPPIAVPWEIIGFGAGLVVVISLLASLWPAIHVARTEPLELLQAGRAAA